MRLARNTVSLIFSIIAGWSERNGLSVSASSVASAGFVFYPHKKGDPKLKIYVHNKEAAPMPTTRLTLLSVTIGYIKSSFWASINLLFKQYSLISDGTLTCVRMYIRSVLISDALLRSFNPLPDATLSAH